MIKSWVRAGVALLFCAGCAAPAAEKPRIPADCDSATAAVRWSEPVEAERLTSVTLFRDLAGTEVLSEPFTTSISGVEAPAEWSVRLTGALSAESGKKIRVGTAVDENGRNGAFLAAIDDPTIRETLIYLSVRTLTADFTIGCATPVTGTLTGWIDATRGSVSCADADEPAEALGREARRFCPRTPAPRSSVIDAIPFEEPSPI